MQRPGLAVVGTGSSQHWLGLRGGRGCVTACGYWLLLTTGSGEARNILSESIEDERYHCFVFSTATKY